LQTAEFPKSCVSRREDLRHLNVEHKDIFSDWDEVLRQLPSEKEKKS
jgi:hypothetical protein